MKRIHTTRGRKSEAGIALLVAIFTLLLISVAAISLVVGSGTESSLAGNYRTSASAYYAAAAGLEEGRGRLMSQNPNYFNNFVAPQGGVLPLTQVRYVLNGLQGEVVAPANLSSTTTYPDVQYGSAFGVPITGRTVQTTTSIFSGGAVPGPAYKWVRISAATEQSINTDVNNDNALDNATPLFYDGSNLNLTSNGMQALEITSLASLPDGSQKILQYVVAPATPITIDAAIHTKTGAVLGDALNVTGYVDPVCSRPDTYGVKAGAAISVPGSGNVTGSPGDIQPNAPFPYNLPALISSLQGSTTKIDVPGTGVTPVSGSTPVTYSGPHATLGVAPTVTYGGSGAITAVTAPGTPAMYISPGDLTLGVPTIGGAAPSGQGVLIVQGNLTIDISNGFNYFGLILVTGNLFMTANPNTTATSNIHGAIIGSGSFTSNLTNLGGSIFVHQNACMVNSAFSGLPLSILSFREIRQ
ncbi:MAG TPA: hypothetical protein VOA64_21270 [Candidatus Dormibacteraeota bacterium]|nr:hypothetical protein [Candidatus Dormibacteraeota bacterium]